MKITERLGGDHRIFRKMMCELDAIAASPPQQSDHRRRIRLMELFVDHFMIHQWGEDVFLYPAVRVAVKKKKKSPGITPAYLDLLEAEHTAIEMSLVQLEQEVRGDPSGIRWPKTYEAFSQILLAHLAKEEKELFPFCDSALGEERLERLSLDLERHRSEAPRAPSHLRIP